MNLIEILLFLFAQNEPLSLGDGAFDRSVMEENYIEEIFAGFIEYNVENSVVIPPPHRKSPLLPVGMKIVSLR